MDLREEIERVAAPYTFGRKRPRLKDWDIVTRGPGFIRIRARLETQPGQIESIDLQLIAVGPTVIDRIAIDRAAGAPFPDE